MSGNQDLAAALERLSPAQRRLFALRMRKAEARPATTVPRRNGAGPPPLSPGQERVWFLNQLEGENRAYINPVAVRLEGPLDIESLSRALQEIVGRHEVLRQRYRQQQGRVEVETLAPEPFDLPCRDLSGEADPEEAARAFVQREIGRAFHLDRDLPFRAHLLALEPRVHVLVLVLHMIVSDGWSLGVLLRELSAFYRGSSAPPGQDLPPLAIQYGDFADWQRQRLDSGRLDREIAYWRKALAGAPPVLELATDRPRPRVRSAAGGHVSVQLPAELTHTLEGLATSRGATLFMVFATAFQLLLGRWSGQQDLTVAVPVSGRNWVETEGLIGLFLNTLVLRGNLRGNPSLGDLLGRVRERTLAAFAHQDVPFERLVEALQPERSLSFTPLCQVALVMNNAPMTGAELGALRLIPLEVDNASAKFDLTLSLWPTAEGMRGTLNFDHDLFDRVTAQRLAGQWRWILETFPEHFESAIDELPWLPPAERSQLLHEWNNTAVPLPADRFFHHLVASWARSHPQAPAIVAGGLTMTYEEMERRASCLAHHLRDWGVGPEDIVGLCVDRTPEMLIGLLAILKAGGAYLPLDPSYPEDRLAFMIEETGVSVLLGASGERAGVLARFPGRFVELREDLLVGGPDTPPSVPQHLDHAAYVLYTSGSTGRPKGTVVSHRGMTNLVRAEQQHLRLGPGSRVLQFASLSFDGSVWEVLMTLGNGACFCLAPRSELFSPKALLRTLQAEEVALAKMPPSVLATLEAAELPKLETVIVAGEACPAELVNQWQPGRRFFNAYGPTENTVLASMAECRAPITRPPDIGRPIQNKHVYLLDAKLLPVPLGRPGELCIGAMGLARGYLRRPGLTAEKFVPDPFSREPGSRLYRTGDLARHRPDGAMEFAGRIDHQVKLRGLRIEAEEIEAVYRRHPAVREVVVILDEDERGERHLVAYYISQQNLPIEVLRRHGGERLPAYMVPSYFRRLETLPLNPSGKADRQKLLQWSREERQGVDGWFYRPRWVPVETPAAPAGGKGRWLLVGTGEERVAEIFASELSQAEGEVIEATSALAADGGGFHLRPGGGDPRPLPEIVLEQAHRPGGLQGIVLLSGWADGEAGFFVLLELARALGDLPLSAMPRIRVVTRGAFAVTEEEGVDPWQGALAAACTVVGQEYVGTDCRALDLPPTESSRAASEDRRVGLGSLLGDRDPGPIAVRNGNEWRRELVLQRIAASDSTGFRPRPEGTYLITGGLGGLGMAVAEWLAAQGPVRLALLGRTPRPELASRLAALEAGGSEVLQLFGDVGNRSSLEQALETLRRRFGAVHGVVHAAGVPAQGLIQTKTPEQAAAVLAPKTRGTLLLEEMLAKEPLDFFVLFSSAGAVSGGVGGMDYCAANGFLDAYAESRRRRGAPVVSIGWGTWSEAGMAASADAPRDLQGFLQERLASGIPTAQGLEALRRILGSDRGTGHWIVTPEDLRSQTSESGAGRAASPGKGARRPGSETLSRPDLETPFVQPRGAEEERIAAIWEEILAVEPVGAHDSFFDLGGHSLQATQVTARIEDALGVEVPLRRLFEEPTVSELADFVTAAKSGRGAESAAIVARPPEPQAPLAFAQERLWFLDQLDPGNPAYNSSVAVRLRGPLQRPALEQTLALILERHQVLRGAFTTTEGGPIQVLEDVPPVFAWVDFSSLPQANAAAAARRRAEEEARQPFTLTAAPHLRALLLRIREQDHLLVLTTHHIVSDAWSKDVLWQEFVAAYSALIEGRRPDLPRLPIQYSDFVHWQRQRLQGAALQQLVEYWSGQLAGMPETVELPADRPRPAAWSYRGGSRSRDLSSDVSDRLKRLGEQTQTTRFMLLTAALAALLCRYSGQEDLAIGSPIASRSRPELEPLIGFFVNTLVLRCRPRRRASFQELVEDVRRVALDAYQHQDLPFERLVEELEPERHLGRNPFFQTMLVVQPAAPRRIELGDLEGEPVELATHTAKFDLLLTCLEGDRLSLRLEYSADLFDPSTADRILGHFATLLEGGVADPQKPLGALPLLSPVERQALLDEWQGVLPPPRQICLHHLVEEQIARTPDAVALASDQRRWSYSQLGHAVERLARRLRGLGVSLETRVALVEDRSPEAIVAMLAILAAGGVFVPLDPRQPRKRLEFLLQDSEARVIVARRVIGERLPDHGLAVLPLEEVLQEVDGDVPPGVQPRPAPTPQGENLAYLIYTSGSTGVPKGVLGRHHGALQRLTWMLREHPLAPGERVVQKTPLFFDVSLWEWLWPLASGGRLEIAPPGLHRDAGALCRWMEERQIAASHFVPSMLTAFLDVVAEEGFPSALRRVYCSGEALTPAAVQHFFASVPAGVELHNLYGPTEAAIEVTHHRCAPEDDPVPIGRALPHVRLYVVDEALRLLPAGVIGELAIGGAAPCRGYQLRPALTAAAYRPDPHAVEAGARIFLTGDLVCWRGDGSLSFHGRRDHQVKIRGLRLELGEVEAAVLRHPAVSGAVAAVQPTAAGDDRLVTYVVGEEGKALPLAEIAESLRELLPEYAIPSQWVPLERLPLNASGKVDRKALPAPEFEAVHDSDTWVPPRTPMEEWVEAVWCQALELDRVGMHDDFFALGGHSLLATRVLTRVRKSLRIDVPLRTLFEEHTPARFARALEAARNSEQNRPLPAVERHQDRRAFPVTLLQFQYWLFDQMLPGIPCLNLWTELRLEGELDPVCLRRAVQQLVDDHDALRTVFEHRDGALRQLPKATWPVVFPTIDLTGLEPAEQKAMGRRLATQAFLHRFDLAKGPLFHIVMLRFAEHRHHLLLTMHHSIADGWSIGILWSDLARLYGELVEGRAVAEPVGNGIQVGDVAAWEDAALRDGALAESTKYWARQLAEFQPLELPLDHPREHPLHLGTSQLPVHLGQHVASGLLQLARQEGATLSMALLAIFHLTLARITGERRFWVASLVANRSHGEVERVVGLLVNTIMLECDLRQQLPFRGLLRQVRENLLAGLGHQEAPFESIARELEKEDVDLRSGMRVVFIFQNLPISRLQLPGLTVVPVEALDAVNELTLTTADLILMLARGGDGGNEIRGYLKFKKDLLDSSTIQQWVEEFQGLAMQMIADPEQQI